MPEASVVICAHTEQRWDELRAALASVRAQTVPAAEVLVVVDHNDALLERAREGLDDDVLVIANDEAKGLSGARNTGTRAARGDVVAFLDDDATAEPQWLGGLLSAYQDPEVIGAGGRIRPRWLGGQPAWFPPEFHWVVGCTYRGMPERRAQIRNPIGANMSARRDLLLEVGG